MKRSFEKFTDRLNSVGLFKEVEARVLALHVTLQELYEGPHAPSIIAARRDVYSRLMKKGKSLNEIARLFDRSPSGVMKLTKGKS